MPNDGSRLVLLCGRSASSRIVAQALRAHFGSRLAAVVVEEPVPRRVLLRKRIKRLGPLHVAGQLLFQLGIVPVLARVAARRSEQIMQERGLDARPFDASATQVENVNSDRVRELLQRVAPTVVVINGTRILDRKTLTCVDAPFVNLHHGLTPTYRGVHGGYWALHDGCPDLVASTLHLVDTGIDTGAVLKLLRFQIKAADNFATYPLLHVAAGLPALLESVRSLLDGSAPAVLRTADADDAPSVLRSHPTAGDYLVTRWRKGVK